MKPSQLIRFGLAAVVLVLLSVACVSKTSSSSTSTSASDSSTVESVGSLSTEPSTGTESAESPVGGQPSVYLPAGPTGDKDDDNQCYRISWLGNPIPHGDIFTVNRVAVSPPLTFDEPTSASCPGQSCLGYQFSAANDNHNGNDEAFCKVGIGYTGGTVDLNSPDQVYGTMELRGHLTCPNVSLAACQHDSVAINVHRQGVGSIPISTFVVKSASSGPSSSPPESTSSSPSESSSSQPATPPASSTIPSVP